MTSLPSHTSSNIGSRSTTTARSSWNRRVSTRHQQPLRAYTVADNIKPSWTSFWKLPPPLQKFASQFGSLEDSLFSFEGGGISGVATIPRMPNLKIEAATVASTRVEDMEKYELLSEINFLTETFATLESSIDFKSQLFEETIKSYEFKVNALEERNSLLEMGFQRMTGVLEKQEQKLLEMRLKKEGNSAVAVDSNAFTLTQVQDSLQIMEGENEMLRQRVRALELELSEAAFESRKIMPANSVAIAASTFANDVSDDTMSSAEASVSITFQSAPILPKPPSEPVPAHILQVQKLQMQVEEYERERSSLKKLFELGIVRGLEKVRMALNPWNPAYNLQLWGELRQHGTAEL
ncbi:hypothetical protein ACHAXA_008655 [Cyclostephanos tholiformis]|uniref:Uncharacterized protein n=1 Tax=Cyclostephanos tholiformis TaxID=382380 RepID=A0ABD3RBH1_9STRA